MMLKRSFLFFLYSTKNIVGCIFGIIGLLAFFAGLIKAYWLFIVIGLYGCGYLLTPRASLFEYNLLAASELTASALKSQLEDLLEKIKKHVSEPVYTKVVNIKDNILMLLPRLDELNASNYDLHVVKQTVVEYLPQMLFTYLELPPAFAKLHKMRNGKTAQEVLIEQLTLLDEQIQQIVINVNSKDADALIAQGEFLKSKFSGANDWL